MADRVGGGCGSRLYEILLVSPQEYTLFLEKGIMDRISGVRNHTNYRWTTLRAVATVLAVCLLSVYSCGGVSAHHHWGMRGRGVHSSLRV